MAERKQITLIYQYNDNWIGGTYYILNIIRSLKFLESELQPELTIIYDLKSGYEAIYALKYPFITYLGQDLQFSLAEKVVNKIARTLLKKPLIKKRIFLKQINNLYPVSDSIETKNVSNFFYWIPDFQEHYLPHFFSKSEINTRYNTQIWMKNNEVPIIFSSWNAKEDYNKFYKGNKNRKEILNFVSIIDSRYEQIDISGLLEKYQITDPYFMVPNQFWKHKNHEVVLKATKILKEKGYCFKVVFTGKEYDHRNPLYVDSIKAFVRENNLEGHIKFLGFIDRDEQLQLMKNSKSIIQPSLFEGWSTVVEDTKALNHFIILSDIPLHREQMLSNRKFFDPYSPASLAETMIEVLSGVEIVSEDYNLKIKEFSTRFLSLFN
ncbi:glycosyltransferase involved in cell wall biosynthesis [Pedobacter psychrotolerans]|uniref:Glycosyl transferase n=1 Tax=Pedobacter psychrotolerans TaxID=1843235 RepID=A0A4R2HEA5_9SPHI|nr:glycosyltransferase [Pedobacter psychrotolerans]TCO26682.1 glycosyltransferase involved in cell wall biosynthesis [Pedobacter psychrotolerans]GGE55693.1 glycosyl transferase [Pedobacter psychrotolerans]